MGTIGERIKELRGILTQKEFAEQLGITQKAIINYEIHNRIPRGNIIRTMCEVFDVNKVWLLNGEEPMFISDYSTETADTSAILEEKKTQYTENTNENTKQTADMSAVLRLQSELTEAVREQNSLIRENGDLRVEIERYRARIRELEREVEALRKAMKTAAVPGVDWQGVA